MCDYYDNIYCQDIVSIHPVQIKTVKVNRRKDMQGEVRMVVFAMHFIVARHADEIDITFAAAYYSFEAIEDNSLTAASATCSS